MQKKALRKLLLAKRKQLCSRDELSKQITAHIVASAPFLNAETVLLYRSVHSEVNTDYLWEACRQAGKRCLFPKCISHTEMVALPADSTADFVLSDKSIPEPVGNEIFPKNRLDLIIVPGVGFDKHKNRLGYGGGFYDRYLADYQGATIGLFFDALLCDDVFAEAWDIPLDWIATENGIF